MRDVSGMQTDGRAQEAGPSPWPPWAQRAAEGCPVLSSLAGPGVEGNLSFGADILRWCRLGAVITALDRHPETGLGWNSAPSSPWLLGDPHLCTPALNPGIRLAQQASVGEEGRAPPVMARAQNTETPAGRAAAPEPPSLGSAGLPTRGPAWRPEGGVRPSAVLAPRAPPGTGGRFLAACPFLRYGPGLLSRNSRPGQLARSLRRRPVDSVTRGAVQAAPPRGARLQPPPLAGARRPRPAVCLCAFAFSGRFV